jgi:NitT/TauT family transport system permease protein
MKPIFRFQTKTLIFSKQPGFSPNFYDLVAFILIMTSFALVMFGIEGMHQPLTKLQAAPLEMSVYDLPKYALYTTLRMLAAIVISLLFTFTVATLAAKNRRAEMVIIPSLDILQSVPVLGFLTFTVTFFMGIFPGNQAGVEMAAIFAVFTAQAWNMAFSFYQSLRTVPQELREVSSQFCLNSWQRFWRLEVPYAIPGLVWNTMMSMSGSWFFVVASEAISVGNTQITLPGIGSWLGTAINNQDVAGVCWAILSMGIVILLYDQIIFRPIVAWSDKFNMGQTASQKKPRSWVYDVANRAKFLNFLVRPLYRLGNMLLSIKWPGSSIHYRPLSRKDEKPNKIIEALWLTLLGVVLIASIAFLIHYLRSGGINIKDIWHVIMLGGITLLRVVVLVFIATIIWVPVGVYVGLRPRMVAVVQPVAQFLAAFPANILFPFVVIAIVHYNLNPDIWLSPLIILGTQWYIFFNVIAGVCVFPHELKEAANIYHVRSWIWWRKVIIPGIFPYYVTGALTATGGSWNASIVAEVVSWGSTKLQAHGLGAYIANATTSGDMHKVLLGVGVMSVFVITLNRIFWRPMYAYAARLTGLD